MIYTDKAYTDYDHEDLLNASCGSTIYEMVHIFDEIFRKICAVDSQRAILKQFFLERSPKDGPVQGS